VAARLAPGAWRLAAAQRGPQSRCYTVVKGA
jgi:hypothetical protein